MTKILIVDDNEQNLYMLQVLLEGHGYEAVLAKDGAEALEEARRDPPDVIIADILMPGMDGFTLCRQWKKDEQLKHIPFVFYTATYTDPKDERFALSLGAERFIIKPTEPGVFVGMLREVIAEHEAGRLIVLPGAPVTEEPTVFREYSERLVKKLEKKVLDLEREATERKRAEEELKAKSKFLESLIEQSPLPTFVIDSKGICVMVNEAFMKAYNVPQKELVLGMNALTEPVNVRQGVVKYLKEALSGKTVETPEIEFISPYENKRTVTRSRLSPILDATGKLTNVVVIHEDITERVRVQEALRASEEKYRVLVENANEAVIVAQDGMLKFVSPKSTEILGYSKEELTSRPFAELIHPDDREAIVERSLEVLKGEVRPGVYSVRIIDKEGNIKWVESNTVSVSWEGRPATLTLLSDITERKRVEEALQISARQWHTTFDAISDAVSLMDLEGGILRCNEALTRLLGKPLSEITGRTCWELVHGTSEPIEGCPVVRMQETLCRETLVLPIGDRWFDVVVDPLLDEDGSLIGAVHIIRDITDRKRAEEALRESEARYRAVVEDQTELICRFLPDGTLTFVNEAYRRYFGKRREELVGYSCMSLIPEGDQEIVRQQMATLSLENPVATYEHRVMLPSEEIRWQQWSDRAIFDDQGRIIEYQSVGRDITERKRLEEMKDNLIRDVSHELKTPLAKMQMGTEMLMEMLAAPSLDRQRVARVSEIVAGNVQRLQRTVNGILDLSSLGSGQIPYHKTKVQPEKLIGQVILDMQPLAEAKGLELAAELPDGLPQVEGDRAKLLRVLTNLVDNAVKFSDWGKIVVSVEEKAREVEIAVSDSGYGILRENLDRVFEKFCQENPTIPGAGVGLAICKTIVAAHGGRIWAESAGRGQGATVRFTLPC